MYYVQVFDIQEEEGANPYGYTLHVRTGFNFGLPEYLTGQVKNNCKEPVPNALIKVIGASPENSSSGMSSADGSFVVSLRNPGTLTATFSAANHQPLVKSVSVPGHSKVWLTRHNNPPVAKDDSVRCPVKKSVSGNVMVNDSDADGDSLVAVLDSNVRNGSLVFDSTGAFTYTHNGSPATTDSFTYHLSDGCTTSETVQVNITIINSNTLPFLMLLQLKD